jgi:hypothetical protein
MMWGDRDRLSCPRSFSVTVMNEQQDPGSELKPSGYLLSCSTQTSWVRIYYVERHRMIEYVRGAGC